MLDVSQRLVVIIGGGNVAARKVKGLLAAGATRIRVVAPQISDEIDSSVERITKLYAPGHLEGAGLVFAATDDPPVNAMVVRDAHQLGLLVNRADAGEDDAGDFSTPAVAREDDLVITVSAGGSPTLAAAIRDQLQSRMDARWVKMIRAMKILRPRAMAETNGQVRQAILRDMANVEALDVLDKDGVEGLWAWLGKRHL
jgi:precorrin-2 dehydrogenase/sirohydrochlorin ferrochelatase